MSKTTTMNGNAGAGPAEVRRAIVVGASRGLGKAIAWSLAERGAEVLATVRTAPHAEAPIGIRHLQLDLNDVDCGKCLLREVPEESIDLLFLSAGILGPAHQATEQASPKEIEELFTTNAIGPVRLARTALPLVRRGGVVAFMSSRLASIALNDSGDMELYRASKAALNSLARSFAVRDALSAGRGVLMLHPGWVQTDMGGPDAPVTVERSTAGMLSVIQGALGQGALGRPSQVFSDFEGLPIPW